jgi:hypothetical protein
LFEKIPVGKILKPKVSKPKVSISNGSKPKG